MTTDTKIYLKINHQSAPVAFAYETQNELYEYAAQIAGFAYVTIHTTEYADIFGDDWLSDPDLTGLIDASDRGQHDVVEITTNHGTKWHTDNGNQPTELEAIVEALDTEHRVRLMSIDEAVEFIDDYDGHDHIRAISAVTGVLKDQHPDWSGREIKAYAAGLNNPGCLPATDPHVTGDIDQARAGLVEELEYEAEFQPEHEQAFIAAIQYLKTTDDKEIGFQCGQFVYWIRQDTYTADDLDRETWLDLLDYDD